MMDGWSAGRIGLPMVVLLLAGLASGGCAPEGATAEDSTGGEAGGLEVVVAGSSFHGVHGVTVSSDGRLFAGSVVGQAIYEIDPESGAVSEWIGPPQGMADDLEIGPDGTVVWTAINVGRVYARDGMDGPIRVLVEGKPGANAVAFDASGRLFFSQVFLGDALWEIDPSGASEPRLILDAPGGLNGFDFGPDGRLYGPLWFKQQVVRVDVDSGELEVIADGFGTPAAANFDSQGNLYVLDTARGEVVAVDVSSGEKRVAAKLPTSVDNLAFSPDDRLYVSNMADNAIFEVDLESGEHHVLVRGQLSVPGGLALSEDGGTLYVADVFAYRTVDTSSGEVGDVARMHAADSQQLEYPISASLRGDVVLLTSWFAGTVERRDRLSGERLSTLHGFAAPSAAVELADGRLVVSELGSSSLVVVAAQDPEERRVVVTELQGPAELWAGDGAKVQLTEAPSGNLIEIDVDSGERRVVAAGLSQPEGLDRLPDGRFVVAEVGARRLVLIDPESGASEVLATDLPIGLPAPAGLPLSYVPTGVAAGDDGSVYFASDIDNAIYRLRSPSR